MTYQNLIRESDSKTADLLAKNEQLRIEKEEMRNAFDNVKKGKEQELKDTHLVFFAKRRELVEKYNDLNVKYEQYKIDHVKELALRDKLVSKWKRKCGEIVQEV